MLHIRFPLSASNLFLSFGEFLGGKPIDKLPCGCRLEMQSEALVADTYF
jgi:hypothetical protein